MSKIWRKTYKKHRGLELRKNYPFFHKSNKQKPRISSFRHHKRPLWFINHKKIDLEILTRFRGNTKLNPTEEY